MSEARFRLIFRGPAVDDGEIDVQDLAPALLTVGDLMQAANDRVNGDRAKAVVRVSATAASCFEVDLILGAQAALEASGPILDVLADKKDGIAAANDLADLVLKVGGGAAATGGGLLALLKWLKGRKPARMEERAGDVHIHLGDTTFITNPKTIQLAEDAAVRLLATTAARAAVARPGVRVRRDRSSNRLRLAPVPQPLGDGERATDDQQRVEEAGDVPEGDGDASAGREQTH